MTHASPAFLLSDPIYRELDGEYRDAVAAMLDDTHPAHESHCDYFRAGAAVALRARDTYAADLLVRLDNDAATAAGDDFEADLDADADYLAWCNAQDAAEYAWLSSAEGFDAEDAREAEYAAADRIGRDGSLRTAA